MIFSPLSGSSGQVPVTPIGGNQMYYRYHGNSVRFGDCIELQGRYRKTALATTLYDAVHYVAESLF